MNCNVVKILCVIMFAFSIQAQAVESRLGLFIEPGVTYELGDSSIDYPSPFSNSSGSMNGLGLLARLGLHVNESLFVALDGRFQQLSFKDSTNNYNADADSYNLAPTIGIQMPNVGLRVWGGYVLLGGVDPKGSNGIDLKMSEASGYRLGAGFRIASLSLNLEYQNLEYGKTELQELGPFSNVADSDNIRLKNNSYIASISFPLEI